MHANPVFELGRLSPAERSALRIDGDAVPLGLTDVPLGVPLSPAVRAASLAPATEAHDLVVELRAAAWVHGAVEELTHPPALALDVGTRARRTLHARATREVRYGRDDVERLGGVRVTTPLRTVFDLLRLVEDPEVEPAARRLLGVAGLEPTVAAALAQLHGRCPGKHRAIARIAALR